MANKLVWHEVIWNQLLTTGEYTPTWKPGHEAHSLELATAICEALIKKLGGIKKSVKCGSSSINYYWHDGKEFSIYHTYDFANFKSSEEPGFAESSHYTIKLNKTPVSKLTKKELETLGWN